MPGTAVVFGSLNEAGDPDMEDHDVPDSVLERCRSLGIEVIDGTAST